MQATVLTLMAYGLSPRRVRSNNGHAGEEESLAASPSVVSVARTTAGDAKSTAGASAASAVDRRGSYDDHDGIAQRALHAATHHPTDLGDARQEIPADYEPSSLALLHQLEAEDLQARAAEAATGAAAPLAWGEKEALAPVNRDAFLDNVLGDDNGDSEEESAPQGVQVEVGSVPVEGAREVIVDDTDLVRGSSSGVVT